MNLPNTLTLIRIIIVPFMIAALLISFPHHYAAALALFIVASLTDMLDGKIARKKNLVTDFGKFADPLADKILVLSAMTCFIELGVTSSVLVIIILFREFAVTSIRLVAAAKGKVVAANIWGKIKTVLQIVAVIATMLFLYIEELISMGIASSEAAVAACAAASVISTVLLWLSCAAALISGVIYIADNKNLISDI